MLVVIFFFNDTATTEIYTLSLHDALPIFDLDVRHLAKVQRRRRLPTRLIQGAQALIQRQVLARALRSEEHTSELQSRQYLVCRLLLEKKKSIIYNYLLPNKNVHYLLNFIL